MKHHVGLDVSLKETSICVAARTEKTSTFMMLTLCARRHPSRCQRVRLTIRVP